MEIAHLREFVFLADTLSFKQTADHFYASRSVISRHLSALEESLGARLVDRSSHMVKLTETGEVFYRDAIALLRDYDMALEHVRISQTTGAMIVRIGYLRNTVRPIIVQAVRYMKTRYPDIKLSLSCMEYGELHSSIEEGSVDVAVGVLVDVDSDAPGRFRSTPISTNRLFAIMGEDNPLADNAEGVRTSDLPAEKLLLPDSFLRSGNVEMSEGTDKSLRGSSAYDFEPYSDADELYLKIQTDDFIVLSTNANSSQFGECLVALPILDVDSTFTISAIYRRGFGGEAYEACREAFESCRPGA